MNLAGWFAQNWFHLLHSSGIIASLLFAAFELRADTQMRRVENFLAINEGHRKIWTRFSDRPELRRVLDGKADLRRDPITPEEEIFVNSVLFHLSGVFYAQNHGLAFTMEGLRQDVGSFLSLPVPKAVWEQAKVLQNRDFVAFVEACRQLGGEQHNAEHLVRAARGPALQTKTS